MPTPSTYRRVKVWQVFATAPPGRLPTPLPLVWPDRTQSEHLDYVVDISSPLADVSEEIVSLSVAASPSPGLTITSPSVTNGLVTVWLDGGAVGPNTVDFTCRTPTRALKFQVAVNVRDALAGEGLPVVWNPLGRDLDFSKPANSQYLLLLLG